MGAAVIPKRRTRPKMGVRQPDKIVCPGHGKYVRGFECALAGKRGIGPLGTPIGAHECQGRMEAHHVTTRGAGGGDEQLAPLCSLGHRLIHHGCSFDVDLEKIAADLWKASPHRIKYEQSVEER